MTTHLPDPLFNAPPDSPAIVWGDVERGGTEISYGDLRERVARAAVALRSHGLGRGEMAAFWHPRNEDSPPATVATIVAMLAAWREGLITAPLGIRLPEAAAREQAERLGADLLDPRSLAGSSTTTYEPLDWALDAPATVVHTSGSSGEPRAVLHSLGNHAWSAHGWQQRIQLSKDARWLLTLPLSHVSGLAVVVRCLLAQAAVVIPSEDETPEEVLLRGRASHASIVDVQLRSLLEAGRPAPPSIEMLLLGGGPPPRSLVAEAVARGWPVGPSYGMTEAASTITAVPSGTSAAALETAGSVLPHRSVRIDDFGEVWVGGRVRFLGYLGEGGGLEEPFDERGMFATGDLGEWVDVEGERMLRIVGRKDNRFKSGGEIVVPEQIEAALLAIAGVRRAVVVPVPDEVFGERPVVVIDPPDIDPNDLRERLRLRLPGYLVPDRFVPWPAGDTGRGDLSKVSRSSFRQYVRTVLG